MKYISFLSLFVTVNVYSQHAMFHAHNQTPHSCAYGCDGQPTMTDARDSKVYNIVQIGTQCWMAENLNYGTYAAVTTPQVAGTKFCQNLSGVNDASCPFGGLYEWTNMMNGSATCNGTGAPPNDKCATNVQGLCPSGWHVPSHYEWTTLEKNVGTNPGAFPYDVSTTGWLGTDEGGNLKQTGTTNWTTPNTGATNSTCFFALPGGYSLFGSFSSVGSNGYWWSATESGGLAWSRYLLYTQARVTRTTKAKDYGFSVRCVKDVCGDPFTDSRDGKVYNTVQIGSQCWMAENLNIGTSITGVTEQTNNATIEKYCYADNADSCTKYGGMYQWAEMVQYTNGATNTSSPSPALPANLQGICPSGWHLPTDAEWCTMENTVEAGTDAGCNTISWRGTNTGAKLKTTTGWTTNNGTNTSGFSALPGGFLLGGSFSQAGDRGFWWSATEYSSIVTRSWYRYLRSTEARVTRTNPDKVAGVSVRCLKD